MFVYIWVFENDRSMDEKEKVCQEFDNVCSITIHISELELHSYLKYFINVPLGAYFHKANWNCEYIWLSWVVLDMVE